MAGNKRNGWKFESENKQETRSVEALDDLAEFELYRQQVLKSIRADIAAGMTAGELLKKYEPQVVGRILTVALAEIDAGKATSAAKDALDRSRGKAAETKTVKHQFEELPDAQLDSLINSRLTEEDEDGPEKEMQ